MTLDLPATASGDAAGNTTRSFKSSASTAEDNDMFGVDDSIGLSVAESPSAAAVAREVRAERRRLFERQRLTGPFGVFVASCAFVALSADHLTVGTRSAWLAAMLAATALVASTYRGPLARRRWSDGIPVLSHVAHSAVGLGWGLTMWLDLDATRDGTVTWIALTMIVAVIAGASAGISGSSALGRNLVLVAAVTTASGLIAGAHVLVSAAFLVFVAVLLVDVGDSRRTWEDLVQLRLASSLDAERNRNVAMHDGLTSSLNRSGIRERSEVLLSAGPCSALYLDLNGFKTINDEWGHRTGDLVLVEIARRLRAAVPAPAIVGRLGGDEFIVLVPTADAVRLDELQASVHRSIERPMSFLDHTDILVSASIGTASTRDDGADLDDLLDRADQDQYRAKRAGIADDDSAIA